ncbi:threonine dehydratase [Sphingomonas sp. LaA6.9]|uniref:threonine dehydratase n=1 Tax=Sphingomonas sp. LaA6.9 TaxID=2919914 RepID=UPI001F4FCD32|nr:threonine dehydratase [Sphingomonas sp. LaA6.9]MCJ8155802.1 threonine dehydratase [Sphingomonas sp. LaA6.9]
MPYSLQALEEAAALVHAVMPPTPQYAWPLLAERTGCDVWVKHENHTPTGAFKARGAITFMDWLRREHPEATGIITATRGNHGQAQAFAAKRAGLTATILVPRGNSVEKNAAMRAFGAELIEHGEDFDEAREEAQRRAADGKWFMVPPFHDALALGVASYALELFRAAPPLDTVYVPIGCGSGICGTIAARNALGLDTKVVGVVSTGAQAAKLSFEAGELIETNGAHSFADGVAVRVPVRAAFDIYAKGADRIVAVPDAAIAEATRIYWQDTHNLAEGAGACPLAALIQEADRMRGSSVGVILSGGNIDTRHVATIMAGGTPLT